MIIVGICLIRVGICLIIVGYVSYISLLEGASFVLGDHTKCMRLEICAGQTSVYLLE